MKWGEQMKWYKLEQASYALGAGFDTTGDSIADRQPSLTVIHLAYPIEGWGLILQSVTVVETKDAPAVDRSEIPGACIVECSTGAPYLLAGLRRYAADRIWRPLAGVVVKCNDSNLTRADGAAVVCPSCKYAPAYRI